MYITDSQEVNVKRQRISRQDQKQVTRLRLLAAAQELFAQKGLEGTSIEEISDAAGYTRGAFYAHFPHKEAVMRALIQTGFDSDLAAIEKLKEPDQATPLEDAYQALGQAFQDNKENLLWMLEFQLSTLRHPDLLPTYREQHQRLRTQVRNLVRAQDPKIKDPEAVGDILFSLVSSLAVLSMVHGEDVPPDLYKKAFSYLLRGALEQ